MDKPHEAPFPKEASICAPKCARLSHRDGKDGYLKDMPLVMHYLRKVCERYVELRPMLRLLDALEGRVPRPKYVV